jgi:hypothetical protein
MIKTRRTHVVVCILIFNYVSKSKDLMIHNANVFLYHQNRLFTKILSMYKEK